MLYYGIAKLVKKNSGIMKNVGVTIIKSSLP